MRKNGKRAYRFIQVASLLIACVLGAMIFAAKVFAQPQKPKSTMGVASVPSAESISRAPSPQKAPASNTAGNSVTSARAAASTLGVSLASKPTASATGGSTPGGRAPAPSPAPSAAGGGKSDEPSPIDYADLQTEADFPVSMSDEEKVAIGTGKVPIHREGPFKSPFAHPRFGGTTTAKVGLVIQEIRDYSIQSGAFEAAFFLSLTGDKELPKLDLTFTNGHEVDIKTIADTPTFKFYHVQGKFESPVDLQQYPFDRQTLNIELEDQAAGVDQLVFVPDKSRTSLDEGFQVASFGVSTLGAHAYRHAYPPRFDRDDLYVSRYKLSLGLDRFATSAAFSVYVPAYIIVLISLIGLWVPADELEVRSAAGAPMLAAAVLFHYSLISALPATGYLTHADKLMLGVYVSLLINMLTTWAFLIVDESQLEAWFKRFRAWVPPLTVAVMAISSIV
jgi:hypothetical protein